MRKRLLLIESGLVRFAELSGGWGDGSVKYKVRGPGRAWGQFGQSPSNQNIKSSSDSLSFCWASVLVCFFCLFGLIMFDYFDLFLLLSLCFLLLLPLLALHLLFPSPKPVSVNRTGMDRTGATPGKPEPFWLPGASRCLEMPRGQVKPSHAKRQKRSRSDTVTPIDTGSRHFEVNGLSTESEVKRSQNSQRLVSISRTNVNKSDGFWTIHEKFLRKCSNSQGSSIWLCSILAHCHLHIKRCSNKVIVCNHDTPGI